ncbi:hypothetical protein H1R20_g706, partial [Candolleomyces eurysporus]
MLSYPADEFIDNIAQKLATRPMIYDERKRSVWPLSTESQEALTVLEVWDSPVTFCNGKPILEIPPTPLWFAKSSPALDWRKQETLKNDTTPGRPINKPMNKRFAFGPNDDGEEPALLNWIWPARTHYLLFLPQLRETAERSREKAWVDTCSSGKFTTLPTSNPSNPKASSAGATFNDSPAWAKLANDQR